MLARRLLTFVLMLVCIASTWMTYDNVFSDLEPTKALAEEAACRVKDCKKPHGFTLLSRMPFGQSFDVTWESGVVKVECHRESYLFGAMRCTGS